MTRLAQSNMNPVFPVSIVISNLSWTASSQMKKRGRSDAGSEQSNRAKRV
jgi:hypothetical protein